MSIRLPDARQLSDDALQVLRLRALRGIELGYTELDLADLRGVCHETIGRWRTAYVADGLPALPGLSLGFLVPNVDLIWPRVRAELNRHRAGTDTREDPR